MPRITSGASFASRIRATCAINSTEKKAQFFTLKRNIRPELEQKGPHNASYLDAAHVQLAGILPSSVCHLIGRESFDFFFYYFLLFLMRPHEGLLDYWRQAVRLTEDASHRSFSTRPDVVCCWPIKWSA